MILDLSRLPYAQRVMWNRYQAGEGVPYAVLPKNGQVCMAATMGAAHCGWPLLIDGSCVNRPNHADVDDVDLDESIITDDMVDAAYEELLEWADPNGIPRERLRAAIAAAMKEGQL